MDAMALLCNLHADGPATLRRLRAFGVGTLNDLHGRDATELARLLEVSPAQARRFVREADQLRDRLGPDAWDPEEGEDSSMATQPESAPERTPEAPLEPRLNPSPIRPIPEGIREQPSHTTPRSPEPLTSSTPPLSSASEPQPLETEPRPAGAVLASDSESSGDASGRLSARDRELLDQVLRRWRGGGAKPQAAPDKATDSASTPAATSGAQSADWLCAGRVSGLGIPQIEKLELAGVRTFTALAECDPLALSKTSGLSFTTLQRLKFLAGRAPAAPAGQTAANVERLSRSERPPLELAHGDTAEPSVGMLMEALSPRQPRSEASAHENTTRTANASFPDTSDEEPSLADLLPHEDEGPGGPFA